MSSRTLAMQVHDVSTKAAARYARRCFWADREELAQEAAIAVLAARRTWDPDVGIPFEPYAWRAAVLHLRTFLWRQSAPVSASHHKVKELKGHHRAELTEELVDRVTLSDEIVHELRRNSAIRERIAHVVAPLGEPAPFVAEQVWLYERTPDEVASDTRLDVGEVRRIARRARQLMSQDLGLFEFWKREKNGPHD